MDRTWYIFFLIGVAAFAQEPTTTTLASPSPSTPNLGQIVTLTASVSSPGALPVAITGKVTFYDGTVPLGIALLTNGSASLQTVSLSAGGHSISALYGGSATYARSRSAAIDLTVKTVAGLGFRAPANFQPTSIAMADLGGDGYTDVVAEVNDTLSTVLNFGSSFNTQQYTVCGGAIVTGDFNGDGAPDLAVTCAGKSNGLSVAIGIAKGSYNFNAAVDYATGNGVSAVAVGDFNKDDKLDIVVVNKTTNTAGIFLNNGNGTFQPMVTYAAGSAPVNLAVGDVNSDGKLDLIVANFGDTSGSNSGNISILLGNGDGTFQSAMATSAGTNPTSIALGDFNGDTKLDLAVANNGSGNISVLLGQGNGTFQVPVNYSVGGKPISVAAADINRDSKPDLAVSTGGSVLTFIGAGNGTFQSGTTLPFSGPTGAIALGDIDGDRKPDLAVTIQASGINVLMGNGDGTFQPPTAYSVGLANPTVPVAVADVNGDGKADLIQGSSYNDLYFHPGSVNVLLGNGDGTFQPGLNYPLNEGAQAIAAGDFNGDGKADLAVVTNHYVRVLNGNGDGRFQPETDWFAARQNGRIAVGDFNGDGNLDLVVTGFDSSASNFPGSANVLLGHGDGTFSDPVTSPSGGSRPTTVAVADFSGDGKADVILQNTGNGFGAYVSDDVLIGNGDGTFQAPLAVSTGGSFAVVDLNGDGTFDLALAAGTCPRFSFQGPCDTHVNVLLGNGNGTFQSAIAGPQYPSNAISGIVAADFNGDGRPDLALNLSSTQNLGLAIQFGNGDGTLQAPVMYATLPGTVTPSEFNSDGRTDLAVVSTGAAGILLGQGQAPPVLTITKQHTGNFMQGQTGATYTIVVSNQAGAPATSGVVTVTDQLPLDFSSSYSLSGTGWACANNSCTRSDSLQGGLSYPPITVTINVPQSTAPSVVNVATVSGGGSADASASDPTTIIGPQLTIAMTHNGSFNSQSYGYYNVTVSNPAGAAPSHGNVTVTVGGAIGIGGGSTAFVLSEMTGTGWSCSPVTSCTRSDVLAAGASYPPITVKVGVVPTATSTQVSTATVSGGGLSSPVTASDSTIITPWAFFTGEAALSNGVFFLQCTGGPFGFYSYLQNSVIYHFDLGYEYVFPGQTNDVYLYDFASGHWWWTAPSLFPYFYDFTLNDWYLYESATPGHGYYYSSNPRRFASATTHIEITM